LQNFGGSKTHNFNSKNLVRPTLNSIRSNFCKEGFLYFVGINESPICYIYSILNLKKKKLELSMLIPFECAKDETKCIKLVAWNRRLDIIDGFCGIGILGKHPIHHCTFNINVYQLHGLTSKIFLKLYKFEQCVVYL
jgi:hypothetical protein